MGWPREVARKEAGVTGMRGEQARQVSACVPVNAATGVHEAGRFGQVGGF
jgi:hypothetical protein